MIGWVVWVSDRARADSLVPGPVASATRTDNVDAIDAVERVACYNSVRALNERYESQMQLLV